MTSREAAKYYWETMKDKPLKEKIRYLLGAYGGVLLAAALILALGISFGVSMARRQEEVLFVNCLNSVENGQQSRSLEQMFLERRGLDEKKYTAVLLTSSYPTESHPGTNGAADMQVFTARFAARELDVIAADREVMVALAKNQAFGDLRSLFTEAELERWSDRLVYGDKAVLEACEQSQTPGEISLTLSHSTEGMEKPIPLAFVLEEETPLRNAFSFLGSEILVAPVQISQRPEEAAEFLRMILE